MVAAQDICAVIERARRKCKLPWMLDPAFHGLRHDNQLCAVQCEKSRGLRERRIPTDHDPDPADLCLIDGELRSRNERHRLHAFDQMCFSISGNGFPLVVDKSGTVVHKFTVLLHKTENEMDSVLLRRLRKHLYTLAVRPALGKRRVCFRTFISRYGALREHDKRSIRSALFNAPDLLNHAFTIPPFLTEPALHLHRGNFNSHDIAHSLSYRQLYNRSRPEHGEYAPTGRPKA